MNYTNILLARSLDKIRTFTNDFEGTKTIEINGKDMSLLEFSALNYFSEGRNILVGIEIPVGLGKDVFNNYEILNVPKFTQGALMTLAWTVHTLQADEPFVVTPIDGVVLTDMREFSESMFEDAVQIGLIVFPSKNPNFSYIRLKGKEIIEFAEKEVIGSLATSGIFYFQNKEVLLKCIEWSLMNNVNRDGQYFLAPALNYAIGENMNIGLWEVAESDYFRFSTEDQFKISLDRLRKKIAN
jgi:NDP-sugar pyrophosphorylase family protein